MGWLSNFTFTFHFHALEKEMATHSSVLAWRIPGTGEPCGLLSMGLHRVGHNWSDLAVVRNPPACAGDIRDASLIPGSGKSPGVGNGNPLQYSYLENSMDRGDWLTTVQWVTKSRTWLSTHAHTWDNVSSYCVQWDVPMWKSQYLLYMDIALHLQEAKERSLHICCIHVYV